MFRLLLLCAFLFPLQGFSQVRGISELGFCHPRVEYKKFAEQFVKQKRIVTGWLDNTFNPHGCPNAIKLMKAKRPVILRIHILNFPGLRNKRLEKHEVHYGYSREKLDSAIRHKNQKIIGKYVDRLNKLKKLVETRKGALTLYVSPCLECDLSKAARKILSQVTLSVLPQAYLVDNPSKGSCLKNSICERHGDRTDGDILDLDGLPLYSANIPKWVKHSPNAMIRFGWLPCNNGLGLGPWVPPTKRAHFCDEEERKTLNAFLRGKLDK